MFIALEDRPGEIESTLVTIRSEITQMLWVWNVPRVAISREIAEDFQLQILLKVQRMNMESKDGVICW